MDGQNWRRLKPIENRVFENCSACLGSLILPFTFNFFAYFKFHSDWGRVIGKIKQQDLDCHDTAPLIDRTAGEICFDH